MKLHTHKSFIKKQTPQKKGTWWGEWHAKVIEAQNKANDYLRFKAGVRRLTKSEFRKKLLEDLKHG